MESKFYTLQEVAQMLRLNVNTVYKYIRMGKLPAARFGNPYRLTESDIQSVVKYQKSLDMKNINEYRA